MTKRTLCIVLGLLVALTPFLGFPSSWEKGIIAVLGIVVAILSYLNVKRQQSI